MLRSVPVQHSRDVQGRLALQISIATRNHINSTRLAFAARTKPPAPTSPSRPTRAITDAQSRTPLRHGDSRDHSYDYSHDPSHDRSHDPSHASQALFQNHSSSSPSASSLGGGVRPPLANASFAASRFSMTRWRISANIAGFSLMNALAFSRPCPIRVVL